VGNIVNIRLSGQDRKAIAAQIKNDIEAACVAHFAEEPRHHLGASEIGRKCDRRIVYGFRWMYREKFIGRMLRLFNRGHKEESRFADWLALIGAAVSLTTPDGVQHRIAGSGHWGGSLDGITLLPERYNLPSHMLTEFKTHNANSFAKLEKYGVQQSKPEHYVQMCVYGADKKLQYGIYMAVNKNDDDLYVEIVELDWQLGEKFAQRAQRLIYAKTLPNRIAATAAYSECKFCPMAGICHHDAAPDVNCRSCCNAEPKPDGTWFCDRWQQVIPKQAIKFACGEWSAFT